MRRWIALPPRNPKRKQVRRRPSPRRWTVGVVALLVPSHGIVPVRDSKSVDGPVTAFVARVQDGQFGAV